MKKIMSYFIVLFIMSGTVFGQQPDPEQNRTSEEALGQIGIAFEKGDEAFEKQNQAAQASARNDNEANTYGVPLGWFGHIRYVGTPHIPPEDPNWEPGFLPFYTNSLDYTDSAANKLELAESYYNNGLAAEMNPGQFQNEPGWYFGWAYDYADSAFNDYIDAKNHALIAYGEAETWWEEWPRPTIQEDVDPWKNAAHQSKVDAKGLKDSAVQKDIDWTNAYGAAWTGSPDKVFFDGHVDAGDDDYNSGLISYYAGIGKYNDGVANFGVDSAASSAAFDAAIVDFSDAIDKFAEASQHYTDAHNVADFFAMFPPMP